MQNKIFIVGKPNVGKSSLFNCLSRKKIALVANKPGLTIDVRKKKINIFDKEYFLFDSAGIDIKKDELTKKINKNTLKKITNETLILFLLDGKKNLELSDYDIAKKLITFKKNIILIINKSESKIAPFLKNDAYKLGLGERTIKSPQYCRLDNVICFHCRL